MRLSDIENSIFRLAEKLNPNARPQPGGYVKLSGGMTFYQVDQDGDTLIELDPELQARMQKDLLENAGCKACEQHFRNQKAKDASPEYVNS